MDSREASVEDSSSRLATATRKFLLPPFASFSLEGELGADPPPSSDLDFDSCGGVGHLSRDCTTQQKCFNCGGSGQYVSLLLLPSSPVLGADLPCPPPLPTASPVTAPRLPRPRTATSADSPDTVRPLSLLFLSSLPPSLPLPCPCSFLLSLTLPLLLPDSLPRLPWSCCPRRELSTSSAQSPFPFASSPLFPNSKRSAMYDPI